MPLRLHSNGTSGSLVDFRRGAGLKLLLPAVYCMQTHCYRNLDTVSGSSTHRHTRPVSLAGSIFLVVFTLAGPLLIVPEDAGMAESALLAGYVGCKLYIAGCASRNTRARVASMLPVAPSD